LAGRRPRQVLYNWVDGQKRKPLAAEIQSFWVKNSTLAAICPEEKLNLAILLPMDLR
jgi:hypothetical protein